MTRDELYIELEGCAGPDEAMPYIDQYVASQLAETEQQITSHVETRLAAERERIAEAIGSLGHPDIATGTASHDFWAGFRSAQKRATSTARNGGAS